MAGKWVQDCGRILNEIKKSAKVKGQDRLDLVRMIRFNLFALQRSLAGWMEWVNNPDVMAQFSLEELKEINKTLSELVYAFVEYDAKITGQTERKREDRPHRPDRDFAEGDAGKKDIFYVK